jgi:glucose-1-phosphate cytidylyltransferase
MKVVILAGGLGSRLSEETSEKPKPMVEVGGRPILWHIMKLYSAHGINDFIICLGYKGYLIKEYFANYALHFSDVTFDVRNNSVEFHNNLAEPWRITLVETGPETMTGGRLKRASKYLDDQPFCFTYGDGVADIDISALIDFHKAHGNQATVTGVQQPSRFGHLHLEGDSVTGFVEKPEDDANFVNGGFFVLSPEVISRIDDDTTIWERSPLESLAKDKQLNIYRHGGFWQSMDTLRDRMLLEAMWKSGEAPWKIWS